MLSYPHVSEVLQLDRVIRAPTPPRRGSSPDSWETLWELRGRSGLPIRAELIGHTDAVEIELFRGLSFRRRWRFLTDSGARGYAARLRERLERRSFQERRGIRRTTSWPGW